VNSLTTGRFAYFGSGQQALNCIYVKNLVHALFLAAESPNSVGEVFNVTDGGRVSKQQFIGRVAELAGLKRPWKRIPLWLAWTLAVLLERRAKRKGLTTPPPERQGSEPTSGECSLIDPWQTCSAQFLSGLSQCGLIS
jgi:nucleoside-diphosphate-sugar epimerase